MYVDPSARRRGIARGMLQFAEDECRSRNVSRLQLSTAEIQQAALALYRNAGYRLVHKETVEGVALPLEEAGPIAGVSFALKVADPRAFRSGRHFASWIGITALGAGEGVT